MVYWYPNASRLAGSGDVTGLHRQTRATLAVTAGIGLTIVAIATVAADPFLGFFQGGEYAKVAVIALPVSPADPRVPDTGALDRRRARSTARLARVLAVRWPSRRRV